MYSLEDFGILIPISCNLVITFRQNSIPFPFLYSFPCFSFSFSLFLSFPFFPYPILFSPSQILVSPHWLHPCKESFIELLLALYRISQLPYKSNGNCIIDVDQLVRPESAGGAPYYKWKNCILFAHLPM